MKRLFAVVGLAAFIAACSDSNVTAPVSRAQPHGASRASDPPPPPLSGSGSGSLDLGGESSDAIAAALPSCSAPGFNLFYTFSYDGNNLGRNQVIHAHLDGTDGVTGDFDVHQNENGKSNAHGHITDGSSSFDIQSGDGTITAVESPPGHFFITIDFTDIIGILTPSTGAKCQVSGGELSGSGHIGTVIPG